MKPRESKRKSTISERTDSTKPSQEKWRSGRKVAGEDHPAWVAIRADGFRSLEQMLDLGEISVGGRCHRSTC